MKVEITVESNNPTWDLSLPVKATILSAHNDRNGTLHIEAWTHLPDVEADTINQLADLLSDNGFELTRIEYEQEYEVNF